jgi:hypothetical protein
MKPALIAVLILSAIIPSKTEHGSLVVVFISPAGDYVVVGAESRNAHDNRPLNDLACKIISLGNRTVFFESGDSFIKITRGTSSIKTGITWNSNEVARSVFRQQRKSNPQQLSAAWSKEALKWFKAMPPQTLRQWAAQQNGRIISGGFVAFRSDGSPWIQNEAVTYIDDALTPTVGPDGTIPGYGGSMIIGVSVELVREFYDRKTLRAINARPPGPFPGADSTVYSDFIRRAIQFAIDNSTETDKVQLGGPIDIAVLRKNQPIEWISRKKECYEQDQK